jgi:hypothetical protein
MVLVLAATLALAAGTRVLAEARAVLFLPTGDAQWIWARLPRDDSTPLAFYSVRDFTLDAVPAGGRLLVLADEEYVVHLNGRRVGSGIYSPGASLDAYDVAPLLRAGGNRILVELRSSRGWGGLLARLEDGAGQGIVTTGEEWRIFRRHQPGLLRGLLVLGPEDGSEAPFLWGRPPVGRWGLPLPGPDRPWPASPPLAAAFGAALAVPPVPAAARSEDQGRTIFHWGREVEGYLALTLAPREEVAVGLLRTEDGVEARSPVLVPPGAREWTDALPRRFHEAEVQGIPGVLEAQVLPLPGGASPLPPPPPGVLGLAPPPLRTPVEEKVRREIERVLGVAGREEL